MVTFQVYIFLQLIFSETDYNNFSSLNILNYLSFTMFQQAQFKVN